MNKSAFRKLLIELGYNLNEEGINQAFEAYENLQRLREV